MTISNRNIVTLSVLMLGLFFLAAGIGANVSAQSTLDCDALFVKHFSQYGYSSGQANDKDVIGGQGQLCGWGLNPTTGNAFSREADARIYPITSATVLVKTSEECEGLECFLQQTAIDAYNENEYTDIENTLGGKLVIRYDQPKAKQHSNAELIFYVESGVCQISLAGGAGIGNWGATGQGLEPNYKSYHHLGPDNLPPSVNEHPNFDHGLSTAKEEMLKTAENLLNDPALLAVCGGGPTVAAQQQAKQEQMWPTPPTAPIVFVSADNLSNDLILQYTGWTHDELYRPAQLTKDDIDTFCPSTRGAFLNKISTPVFAQEISDNDDGFRIFRIAGTRHYYTESGRKIVYLDELATRVYVAPNGKHYTEDQLHNRQSMYNRETGETEWFDEDGNKLERATNVTYTKNGEKVHVEENAAFAIKKPGSEEWETFEFNWRPLESAWEPFIFPSDQDSGSKFPELPEGTEIMVLPGTNVDILVDDNVLIRANMLTELKLGENIRQALGSDQIEEGFTLPPLLELRDGDIEINDCDRGNYNATLQVRPPNPWAVSVRGTHFRLFTSKDKNFGGVAMYEGKVALLNNDRNEIKEISSRMGGRPVVELALSGDAAESLLETQKPEGKNITLWILIFAIIGAGGYFLYRNRMKLRLFLAPKDSDHV